MTGGSSFPSWRLLSALRLLSGWGVNSDAEETSRAAAVNDNQRRVLKATIVCAGVPIALHLFIPGTAAYLSLAAFAAVVGICAYLWEEGKKK